MGICPPPRPIKAGPLCATSENTGPSTRQTPEAEPSTRRSTDYAHPLWCGHPKSHLYPSGIRVLSFPSLSQVPNLLFYLGLGWVPSGARCVFFLLWLLVGITPHTHTHQQHCICHMSQKSQRVHLTGYECASSVCNNSSTQSVGIESKYGKNYKKKINTVELQNALCVERELQKHTFPMLLVITGVCNQ